MINYILVNSKYRNSVKDVKVIPVEEVVIQLLIDVVLCKIQKEIETVERLRKFAELVNNKCDGNEDWCDLKRKLML